MRHLLVVLMMAAVSIGAYAQEEPPESPPADPAAIMRSADAAIKKIEALSVTIHARGIGALATRTPELQVAANLRRAGEREPMGWHFRVEGAATSGGERRELLTAYDGREVRSVRAHEKSVVSGSWQNSAEPMADGAGWALTWIIRWGELVSQPFGDGGRAMARHDGTATVEGELCDVVYVDYSETSDPTLFDGWWFIARSDSLPRRFDMHLVDHRSGDGFLITTLSDLAPGAEVETARLTLPTPEGFESKAAAEPRERVSRRRPAGIAPGEMAPDWALMDPSGKEHRLSDYRGKVVIMDFWATWCGPCLRAMPGLQALHESYKDDDVVIFGINCWESGDPEALMKDEGYSYTLLLEGDPVATQYSVSGIPTFYIVGPDGRIAHHAVGFDPLMEEKLEKIIESLLP
jgi:thiol-disulfide isomerase/thioredoxin